MSMPVSFANVLFPKPRTARAREEISTRQLAELQKQAPSLYALLVVNAAALAWTHYPFAPAWLTFGVLAVLGPICIVRAIHWWRLSIDGVSPSEAAHCLRRTTALSASLALPFVLWAFALNRYGGPFEHAHVVFFVAITVIACIFCLTHLPVAAYLVTLIVGGVFLFNCLTSGNGVFVAMAWNTAFVAVVMVRILSNNFAAFVQLVDSQADVSAQQGETQRLIVENARLAHTDSLTELPNRRYFFLQVEEAIEIAAAEGEPFALGILDLDRFKSINDTYGHLVGDRHLAEMGRRLSSFQGERVLLARLGGDEFGLLIRSPCANDALVAHCDRICQALAEPIRFGDTRLSSGCSAGVALYPDAGHSADILFDRADYALYHSKERRRGATTLFTQKHEDAIRAERAVETALQNADLDTEMEVHFQPVLDVSTNRISMVEALARWTSPTLGAVSPDRFIAAAERGGTIHSLTLLLLGKALAGMARLPAGVGLSFNLSSHDLGSSETVLAVLAAVRASGVDPRRLTLELTETALMADFETAKQSIVTLRALGIAIALDDFGTGYSSLGYVHRLPLDKIKIDRSFMAGIETAAGRSIVTTVLDLCQNLGLDCIAEGVETDAQLRTLRGFGCRYVQGYLVGKPMPIDAVLGRLQEQPAPSDERLRA